VTNPNLPQISIIIPCRNEAAFIDGCLRSIYACPLDPQTFEVLVVDGQSTDSTPQIVQAWADQHPNLRLLRNSQKIVPVAMNLGIEAAQGSILIRMDAHATYPSNYIPLCVETLEQTQADNVGGIFVTLPRGEGLQAQLVQAISTHRVGVGNASYRLLPEAGYTDTIPYGCYPRATFERFGKYDERLVRNQDYEFNRRIMTQGGKIWLNPQVEVHYYNQPTLLGLYRQAFFTGKWNAWMWILAHYTFMPRHAIPAIFVLALLFGLVLGVFSSLGSYLLALMLIPYTLLTLWAGMEQTRRYHLPLWAVVGLSGLFFGYHLAYGSGTLYGAVLLLMGRADVQK
jgi:glycosyltransferase involved in cell wall biosynthesis